MEHRYENLTAFATGRSLFSCKCSSIGLWRKISKCYGLFCLSPALSSKFRPFQSESNLGHHPKQRYLSAPHFTGCEVARGLQCVSELLIDHPSPPMLLHGRLGLHAPQTPSGFYYDIAGMKVSYQILGQNSNALCGTSRSASL